MFSMLWDHSFFLSLWASKINLKKLAKRSEFSSAWNFVYHVFFHFCRFIKNNFSQKYFPSESKNVGDYCDCINKTVVKTRKEKGTLNTRNFKCSISSSWNFGSKRLFRKYFLKKNFTKIIICQFRFRKNPCYITFFGAFQYRRNNGATRRGPQQRALSRSWHLPYRVPCRTPLRDSSLDSTNFIIFGSAFQREHFCCANSFRKNSCWAIFINSMFNS